MRCRHAGKMISRYMDDELGPPEKEDFDAHIRSCAACREALEDARSLQRLFASAPRFPAPYGFATRVMSKLKEPERFGLWRIFSLQPLFLRVAEVAFALLIIIMGVISGSLLVSGKTMHVAEAGIREAFSLDLFEATPPGSVGGVYIAMTGANHER